jgi:pilus assembly protein CpaE
MAQRILAVDDNPVNLKVVTATLARMGYEVFTAENGLKALGQVEQVQPDLIILDIGMPEMDGYEVCRRLRGKASTAQTPIMMLTAHDSLEEKIKGFEAGADEYLTKPFQPVELQARVKVLLKRGILPQIEAGGSRGKIISVFSLRGGVGVTSIATNLAVELAQLWGTPVGLVDLVLTLGQSALMLNLPLKRTWAELSSVAPNELDAEVVQNVLLNHLNGVSVLASPRRAEDGERVSPELVAKLLEVMKKTYAYTILDLPHDFRATTLAGLDASDEILLVMAPELASIRSLSGVLEVFDKINLSRQKVHPVLNWTFERRGLARKDIENALKIPIQYVVPFASDLFVSAINLGVPPVQSSPDTPITELFEDLAYSLSSEEDKEKTPAKPTAIWQKFMDRSHLKTVRH